MKIFYDLHIHTCLSPCALDEMTPNNVVNMSLIKGLDVIAITDHNSIANCEAAMEVAEDLDILVIPGMELQTIEDIHLVCLFPDMKAAKSFDRVVDLHRLPIKNRPTSIGHQRILNANDDQTDEEPIALIASIYMDIETTMAQVEAVGGVAFPAHIDRASHSVLISLGFIPPDWSLGVVECSGYPSGDQMADSPIYKGKYTILRNSDAHELVHISEPVHTLEVEEKSNAGVLNALRSGPQ